MRGWRRLGMALGVVAALVLVLLATLYLNRRAATREVLIGWLERQGIDADMQVERVELDGIVASVRIGDPANPDVVIERVEVDYAVATPWSRTGLGVTPSRIRLIRPVVRAGFREGKLTLGSLDLLIDRFTGQPPRPDTRSPLVVVEQGRLQLDTDYGPVTVLADARVDNGKLMQLNARLPETALRSGDIQAQGLKASVQLTTTGDRVDVRASASADAATASGVSAQTGSISLNGNVPYPDLKTRRGDGAANLQAVVAAVRLRSGGTDARDLSARLSFDGRMRGWIETFAIEGQTGADIRTARLDASGATATGARLMLERNPVSVSRDADGLTWRIDGPLQMTAARASGAGLDGEGVRLSSRAFTLGGRGEAVEFQAPLTLQARRLTWDALSLSGVDGAVSLDAVVDQGFRVTGTGRLRSLGGAWPLFGPAASDDIAELGAMKRALGDFAVDIPAFTLAASSAATRVTLDRAATLTPRNGGVLTLRPATTPIFSARDGQLGGGALALTATRGQGLPEAAFDIPAWRLTPGGFTATLDGRAALDFDLAKGIALQTRGELASNNGRLTYVAATCIPLTLERLALDESDVTAIAGQICPGDRPLVTVVDGGWRAEGLIAGLNASAPFLALNFRDAKGRFVATGGPSSVGLEAQIASVLVVDATTPARFNPVTAQGSARLADENWTGTFDLARNGTALGRMTLAHDGRAGAGGLTVDASSIVFAEPGLQPDDLSPLVADFIQSPATGSVGFQGRIDWSSDTDGSSSGRLTIPGLDFVSPAGPVKGLRGTVDFTSLAPLITAPAQRLTIDTLESVAPITDVAVTFDLAADAFIIDGGEINIAGGKVTVEPFAVPLDISKGFSGVITLDRVQLGEVVANSGFADKVTMDAVVSGRLPYTYDPTNGIRIQSGTMEAVQPGRLSISRDALTGVQAGGAGGEVPPNTVQDLAFQAMENLAFDVLTAQLNSLDEGRIGVIFHIKGRHEPPQYQDLRVTIPDLISREFLNRPIPLPSGTAIDLTLDTTLNANELAGDLMQLNRSRNGEVSTPRTEPDPEPPAAAPAEPAVETP
ncbi:MAG: C4-dicarboxylate ABC transporter [Alphaproteobacteria bacterium]|nr:MAG: C4-dicarboxylate ABC transporter [Alphaproteobacteria bacterium]